MKNKSYIGISFIILIFGIWAIPKIIDGFKNNNIVEGDRLNRVVKTKKSGLVVIDNVPSFSLTNQKNQTISDKDMLGKVYVLEFFFSTCPTICPIMNRNLIDVEKKFTNKKDFGIVSVTINPKHDTPEVLKNHKETHLNITSDNWHFLTSERQEDIHKLARKFNMYVGENIDAPGGFEHSGLFALIDKNGKIRCRTDNFGNPILYYSALNFLDEEGFEEDPYGEFRPGVDAIIEDIEKLLNE